MYDIVYLIRLFGMSILSTKEAAEKLNVSPIRVRQLIADGRLPAKKIGRDYIIEESDLKAVENRRSGRPKKIKADR